ncbi:MAG TPA: mechanosensitive ion channel domain-containing protein [Ramlibacter sp.]|uniref:mechanosensitive ion channel family protein n=1 Tax=Ramlibacter sp. TaxID=1917967 RepID=UPI002D7F5EA0|nr:mechanosensitive ion channel domain-containing protein [Ramlibacter sp.]HET8744993.1 mechanosensitive ion channel domain-containing protein [Ramlibacter sp.]
MAAWIQQVQDNPTWLFTLIVALVAALGATVVHVSLRALLKRMTRNSIVMRSMLDCTERAAAVTLPLLAMQVVFGSAPDNLASIGFVRHTAGLLLIAAVTWLLLETIEGLANGVIESNPRSVEDNLQARRIETQTRVLSRSAMVLVLIAGIAIGLMTFPGARQLGASLLASAGVLGLVAGLAARPIFSNLIAGVQLALAQPIRIDDVLIVKGEWGRVEEITGTYVVLKIWDERRLVIPLQWFIENPFENWTRTGSNILGTVFLYLDYATPLDAVRAEAKRIVESAPEWDGRVFVVQVTDTTERCIQVRVLVSASNSGKAFDLRCRVREGLVTFLAREHPQALPVVRNFNEIREAETA